MNEEVAMTDTLLRSLREHLLDESEPLAGLLRKCLLLGAETGSDSLRQWARYELNGYEEGVELPSYRMLPAPTLMVDSFSGPNRTTGQAFDRLQLPPKARECVPEKMPFHQPIEELQKLAEQKTLSFTGPGLGFAVKRWNDVLDWRQQVTGMHFELSGSVITGILGQIRTQLVDMVADLTAETPLAELPGKAAVDAAVEQHIGTQYITTIQTANGPTAIGTGATAKSEGLSLDEAIRLIEAVRLASDESGEFEGKSELLEAAQDLRAEIVADSPSTGEVIKKAGRLQKLAEGVGLPLLTAAAAGAVEAVTGLALGGAFG